MSSFNLVESGLDPARAGYDFTLPAGEPWLHEIKKGQVFRILDLEATRRWTRCSTTPAGRANANSAQDTLAVQGSIYLTSGSQLMSNEGKVMLTIVADTCGRHDTLGGACAAEEQQRALTRSTRAHAQLPRQFPDRVGALGRPYGLTKRDIAANINFFMNVPVTPAGGLSFADGVSAPGKYVELRAEMDVLALISNCPQLNNPCNAYNPTPVRLLTGSQNEKGKAATDERRYTQVGKSVFELISYPHLSAFICG